MIVITLSDCPPKVRGDLSKWLFEINTGVYVGNLSARVRQELWRRICENLKNGRATMVYSAPGEQQLRFETHNSLWDPIDLDGIKLMRRPLYCKKTAADDADAGIQSRAGKLLAAKHREAAKLKANDEYIVIDIETTGLSVEKDRIIEIAAILVRDGKIAETLQMLVRQERQLPLDIIELTKITDEMLELNGIPIKEALERLVAFVADRSIVCHNARFDCEFLRAEAKRCQVRLFQSQCKDTLYLAKRRVSGLSHYTLQSLCKYFGIETNEAHRALTDCMLTFMLYEKLNEI